jgi:carbon-monoxide dehydrogenase large subunit
VLGIFTAKDLVGLKPMRAESLPFQDYKTTEWPILATGKVRFVGEAVAAVIAVSPYIAADAAADVEVEYEPLDAVVDVTKAIDHDSPRVHDEWPDNVLMRSMGGGGDTEAAFAAAEIRVSQVFHSSPVTGVPIEPRGCLAHLNPADRVLTVRVSHQAPHILRSLLADHLGYPEHLIRVVCPNLGGGFGIKVHLYPEELFVAFLALTLRRPLKWVQSRQEDLLCNTYCRDHLVALDIAASRDGRILGMTAKITIDGGAYSILPGFGPLLEATGAARQMPGPYRLPAYAFEAVAVVTNKVPRGAYRGVSTVTATFCMERMLELLAAQTGLDSVEVRKRNLISESELPYRNALGVSYEDVAFAKCLDGAVSISRYNKLREGQEAMRQSGRYIGIGIACYAEFTSPNAKALRLRGISQVPGYEAATVRIDPDGTVRADTSVIPMGQGLETTLAQVIADEVGVRIEDVTVRFGDTSMAPYGSGSFASRSAVVGGGAAALAARTVKNKLLAIAAHVLEVQAADLTISDGQLSVKGAPFRRLNVRDVARRAHLIGVDALPDGITPGLEATNYYEPPLQTISNGVHIAVVEVDIETGVARVLQYFVAHDCGKVINPMIVDGQIHGGVGQGVGQALVEAARYDDLGQILTASLGEYALPRATDMPAQFAIVHFETPSSSTVNGVKGMGEGGTIGSVAAVANAVADALKPFGARVAALPLVSQNIWAQIGGGKVSDRSTLGLPNT